MTTSILIRTNPELKNRFEKQAKKQGLSMTFLLTRFMETYADRPEWVTVHFDDAMLDSLWTSTDISPSLQKLSHTLESKWL